MPDYVSREVLQPTFEDTERHIHHPEKQVELVAKVGTQSWLQSRMGDSGAS